MQDSRGDEIAKLAKDGGDFAVFPASGPVLTGESTDKTGKILQIAADLSESMLRTINTLSVDAVLADEEAKQPLTWHRLMLFHRLTATLSKPLLVAVSPDTTPDEIKVLWEAGVAGVVIEADKAPAVDKLKKLYDTINRKGFLPPRTWGKNAALLPRPGMEPASAAEGEEEEED